MAEETILFTQGIEMPPDVLDLVPRMKPEGFALKMLPPRTSRDR